MRFLIVDDSSTMRRIMINTLPKGARQIVASRSVEAVPEDGEKHVNAQRPTPNSKPA